MEESASDPAQKVHAEKGSDQEEKSAAHTETQVLLFLVSDR